MADALKHNYSLVELKGVSSPFIERYLARNKTLEPFIQAIQTAIISRHLDGEIIEQLLKQLNTVVLPDDTVAINEIERLLTGLGHMTNPGGEQDALDCFLPSFDLSLLQEAANIFSSVLFLKDEKVTSAQCQFALYVLGDHLHKEDMALWAYVAFNKLQERKSGSLLNLSDIHGLCQSSVLLSYRDLVAFIHEASTKNEHEQTLLDMLSKQTNYHPLVMNYLVKSPAFINAFKVKYPNAQNLIVPEHCLWAACESEQLTLLFALPEKTPDSVNIKVLNGYTDALKNILAVAQDIFALKKIVTDEDAAKTVIKTPHISQSFFPAAREDVHGAGGYLHLSSSAINGSM